MTAWRKRSGRDSPVITRNVLAHRPGQPSAGRTGEIYMGKAPWDRSLARRDRHAHFWYLAFHSARAGYPRRPAGSRCITRPCRSRREVPLVANNTELAVRAARADEVALARKNFSIRGQRRVPIAFTILGCCRIVGLDPVEYLADVLPRLVRPVRLRALPDLLPHRWKARRDSAVAFCAALAQPGVLRYEKPRRVSRSPAGESPRPGAVWRSDTCAMHRPTESLRSSSGS